MSPRPTRRVVLAGLATAATLPALRPARAQGEIWSVSSEDNFPPYNFWMKGRRIGIDVDIVAAVLEEIAVTPLYRGLSWDEVVNSIDADKVDVAFQFTATPARMKTYHMVGPHRVGSTVLVGRADFSRKIESLSDLRGLTIGVVQGFAYTPEFDASQVFERLAASTNLTNFRRLLLGRVDLIVGDQKAITYLADNDGMADRIKVLPNALGRVPRYIALPGSRTGKAERFQAAFDRLKAIGTIDNLVRGWKPI